MGGILPAHKAGKMRYKKTGLFQLNLKIMTIVTYFTKIRQMSMLR